jgi:hypothetical protein
MLTVLRNHSFFQAMSRDQSRGRGKNPRTGNPTNQELPPQSNVCLTLYTVRIVETRIILRTGPPGGSSICGNRPVSRKRKERVVPPSLIIFLYRSDQSPFHLDARHGRRRRVASRAGVRILTPGGGRKRQLTESFAAKCAADRYGMPEPCRLASPSRGGFPTDPGGRAARNIIIGGVPWHILA